MGNVATVGYGSTAGHPPPRYHVRLLGDFAVTCDGRDVRLSADAQRLVAFLALRGSTVQRTAVAGHLWADSSQERAFGNLRSALWRVHRCTEGLLEATGVSMSVASAVEVDVDRPVGRQTAPRDPYCESARPTRHECLLFSQELLADWSDEWVVVERERMRQVSLHLLEFLSSRLADDGEYPGAMETALAAIRLDPLRESAHRCAIRVHLAEGNYSDALRHADAYTALLQTEMGINPSPHLRALLGTHDLVLATVGGVT